MSRRDHYDCIVIGAGAGGATAASAIAAAGRSVLVVERGQWMDYDSDGYRDHLRNQRYARYGHNAGPDTAGNPRVLVDPEGHLRLLRPHEEGYGNNAAAVGGVAPVYGAQAWRFLPDDFRIASKYGVPPGSSLVDWPISYQELAPFYEEAEWTVGVSGAVGRNDPWGREREYPMPPVPQGPVGAALQRGAAAVGIETIPTPLLINTEPYNARAACIQCGSCIGFTCPTDAKNGAHNTLLSRALGSDGCELLTGTTVEQIDTDAHGHVVGVTAILESSDGSERRTIRSKAVVVSAGASETARLLLLSRSALHPSGLGNEEGQVGLHLQAHSYPTAFGMFEYDIYDPRGPGVTTASTAYNHDNEDIIGGGMLSNDFILLPIIFWKQFRPANVPVWGAAAKDFMRRNYRRTTAVRGPVHEIPSPVCRVEIDPLIKDRLGLPVARLSGVVHPETQRTAAFMLAKAKEWLLASGAVRVWGEPARTRLSSGQHQAGTCRMGTDPGHSVTDCWGRVWGHDNLFVADGSLHPTNGGFNPCLDDHRPGAAQWETHCGMSVLGQPWLGCANTAWLTMQSEIRCRVHKCVSGARVAPPRSFVRRETGSQQTATTAIYSAVFAIQSGGS